MSESAFSGGGILTQSLDGVRARAAELALGALPVALRQKITELLTARGMSISDLSEIRARAGRLSFVTAGAQSIAIPIELSGEDILLTLEGMTRGAMHIHRETLLKGYISLPYGIRVGVVGSARYEGGRICAVGDARALVFRLPFFDADIGRRIRESVMGDGPVSCLIYSPPGGGKTTALRSLAYALGEVGYMRAVAVDERRELFPEPYLGLGVDILSGFHKAEGVELATRYLNPELILIDELSSNEAEAVRQASLCGVPIVATAHAGNRDELYKKDGISGLLSLGVFYCTVGIVRQEGRFRIEVERV
ncbi:MAG: hypothetical protein IJF38_03585 [Clostridia bacterium]|nr:hypothetical protein [Clostridia bacterium]